VDDDQIGLGRSRALMERAGVVYDLAIGDHERLPFADGVFDAVFCTEVLEHLRDPRRCLREIRRVLAPGGRVLVSVPTPTRFFDGLETALARNVPAAAGFVRMVFSLDDPAQVKALFRNAGFTNVAVRAETKRLDLPSPREFLWQYIHCTPLAGLIPEGDEHVRAALERDIAAAWQPWVVDGGMRYDQGMLVASA
jgi:SAM-dependent methyltransferase